MLTPTQTQTLRAAVDRLIPPDVSPEGPWPGGWDAGVGEYLSRLLTAEPRFLFTYARGLDGLDAEARAAPGGGAPGGDGSAFAALGPDAQDALLARVEAGDVATDWPTPPAGFFRLLCQQAMEGFYADPGNGGNRGGVAWRMIGFQVTA